MHKFGKISGSTTRTLAEPEPMTLDEQETFLNATKQPAHRAMFGLQLGQGLRAGSEVYMAELSDFDWKGNQFFVRGGTKNSLAKAWVPMTALTRREMLRWWEACGRPTMGRCFTTTRGKETGHPFRKYPRSAFRAAVLKSGLNKGRVRKLFPNVCRHSFATAAADAKIDRAHTRR